MAASDPHLAGKTVLLVEDDSMVSMMSEDVLHEAGCTVLLAMRLDAALELARRAAIDLAVLDINLGGEETSYPVADLLASRGIPLMFVTGYDADSIAPRFAANAKLQKPYDPAALIAEAARLSAVPGG